MTARAPALSARAVSKTFPGGPALQDFEIDIAGGEIHALVGENGSGKSTFVKILAGYHDPDPGARIVVAGTELSLGNGRSAYTCGCRFVHQDLGLIDARTVVDNLSLSSGFPTRFGSIRTREADRAAREDLRAFGLQIDPRALVSDLGPAARTGVAIVRALRSDGSAPSHLLVLDEPTATMPDREVEHLLSIVRAVAARGIGVLYVSHRLDEVLRLCRRVTVLRDGRRVATRAVGELRRPELVSIMVGSDFREAQRRDEHRVARSGSTGPALRLQGIAGERVRDFSVDVAAGQVVGIAGITGSGREQLLMSIFDAGKGDAGQLFARGVPVHRSPRACIAAGIGYLPPDRRTHGAMEDKTARENLTILDLRPFWRGLRLRRRVELAETGRWFSRLEIRPWEAHDKAFATFSGGNQQKLLFARWMRTIPRILLLEEPTQGVDIAAKALLHQQIASFAAAGGAVLVSSSDSEELVALCDRVTVLRDGEIVADLDGPQITVAAIARHSLGTVDTR